MRVSGNVSAWLNVAAIDVNAELFDTWSMYSSVALTALRSPALTLNSGVNQKP